MCKKPLLRPTRVSNTMVSHWVEHKLPQTLSSCLLSIVLITGWGCEHFSKRPHPFLDIFTRAPTTAPRGKSTLEVSPVSPTLRAIRVHLHLYPGEPIDKTVALDRAESAQGFVVWR